MNFLSWLNNQVLTRARILTKMQILLFMLMITVPLQQIEIQTCYKLRSKFLHLHGNNENPGLLKDLSQRLGILKRLRNYLRDISFKTVLNGIFVSKLIYDLSLFGGVLGISENRADVDYRSSSITKKDMQMLQILQNSVLRLLLRKPRDTSLSVLLAESRQLSVHQLVAYHLAIQTYKIHRSREPAYHF